MRNVIIIGSGPAGYTSAIYTARANLSPLVLASEPKGTQMPGGQLMFTGEVENFPGFPEGISGPDLMERMKQQALRFSVEMIDEDAEDVSFTPGGPFSIRSRSGWHEARTVIVATGANARWLNLPDEEKFRGRGLSACAICDGMFFRNQEVMVVGGGDTAVEEALTLARFALKVTIVHRRNELRVNKIMRLRAENNPKIHFLWNTIITSYHGESVLEAVGLRNVETGREWTEKTAGVFMGIGHHPNTEFLKGALELDTDGYIAVHNEVETSVFGVFAAGDVADRNYSQAITAAAFGCMAGLSVERWLTRINTNS